MAKVYSSVVVPAPATAVWAVVHDFNALPNWTSFVAESRIEQNKPSDQIGCIRNFRLKDGGRIRERLLALSDYEMSFEYIRSSKVQWAWRITSRPSVSFR